MRTALLFLFCFLVLCTDPLLKAQEYRPPAPYGGMAAIHDLIRQEMIYPPKALEEKIDGKVVLDIYFTAGGDTDTILTISSTSKAFEQEARRLLSYILWEPATDDGKPIPGRKRIEIDFNPKKYNRINRRRGNDIHAEKYTPVDHSMKVFELQEVSTAPQYILPGDYKSLDEFIARKMEYPELAKKRNLSGRVEIQMIIEPSGRTSNMRITEGVGAGCDEEAMRLARLIKWTPGIKDSTYVRTIIELNITFALANGSGFRYFPTYHGTTMQ